MIHLRQRVDDGFLCPAFRIRGRTFLKHSVKRVEKVWNEIPKLKLANHLRRLGHDKIRPVAERLTQRGHCLIGDRFPSQFPYLFDAVFQIRPGHIGHS